MCDSQYVLRTPKFTCVPEALYRKTIGALSEFPDLPDLLGLSGLSDLISPCLTRTGYHLVKVLSNSFLCYIILFLYIYF